MQHVADEMEHLSALGLQRVFFLDMTFTQNRVWAVELCQELISRNNKLKWLCQTRCDCADPDLLALMKQAGCCGVEYGIETYDDASLASLNKQIDTDTIVTAIHACQELNLATSAFLMVGTPYESEESICQTMDMLKQLGIAFIPIIYTPRIGSRLGDEIAQKYSAADWEDLLRLRGRLSEHYSIMHLIKDHSVLKGESMGTVLTDFENTDLNKLVAQHRTQFENSPKWQANLSLPPLCVPVKPKSRSRTCRLSPFQLSVHVRFPAFIVDRAAKTPLALFQP